MEFLPSGFCDCVLRILDLSRHPCKADTESKWDASTSIHNKLAVPAQDDPKKKFSSESIERSDDFIDQRLHVEVIGWRNADTPTGFFDRTGNDGPNGGYFCP